MASPTATRRIRKSKPSFGGAAPLSTIPFPKKANMTAVEILAFLPNSIDCADVVYRLISNGGSRKSIHAIINTHRESQAGWSLNWCGEAMYKTMAKAGYINWTITRHDQWHDQQKSIWDDGKLDVGDLRATPGGPAEDEPLSRLAENVRAMPEGDDALDLTRMVQYCLQNAEDGWLYPRDYEELLQLIGGPAQVGEENIDRAVLKRWENKKPPPPPPLPTSVQPLQEVEGMTETRKRCSVARRTSKNTTPGPSLQVKATTTGEKPQMSAAQGTLKDTIGGLEIRDELSIPYTRPEPRYVPPSLSITATLATSIVLEMFRADGVFGETDPYSAYAFERPRRSPPYRCLHQIAQPRPWDISGWAENLRWAFEQRVLFGQEHAAALGWNESPAHMAYIEQQRIQGVWASDELLEVLQDVDQYGDMS